MTVVVGRVGPRQSLKPLGGVHQQSLALGRKARLSVCCSAGRERGRERDVSGLGLAAVKVADSEKRRRRRHKNERGDRESGVGDRDDKKASSRRSFGVAALSSSVCLYKFFRCPSKLVAEELSGSVPSVPERPTMVGPPMDAASPPATADRTASSSPPQASAPSGASDAPVPPTPSTPSPPPPSPPTSPPPTTSSSPSVPPPVKDEKTPTDRFMVRKSRLREIQELRDSLATKEFALMQKQQELEDKDRSMNVLTEQLALEKKLRDILIEEKDRAIEEAKLAAGLCSQGGMMP